MDIDFEDEFLDYILDRGYEYYINNKVSDVVINHNVVSAIVKGNYKYEVNLEIEDEIFIEGNCSCPYFESNGNCKHMAAVLYYLKENGPQKSNSKYDLKGIINRVSDKDVRKFLYNNLVNNSELLNKFRIAFSKFFPKLSKEEYKSKIYQAINKCCGREGFIDYSKVANYRRIVNEYLDEARDLVAREDYETAFIIVSIILDSIPNTNIDDSNGTTGDIATDAIGIILDILEEIDEENEAVLKNIVNYVITEIKTSKLLNYGIDLKIIVGYFINAELYLDEIKTALEIALDQSRDKIYFYDRESYINYLLEIGELRGEADQKFKILEKYSYDKGIFFKYIDELIKKGNSSYAIEILEERLHKEDYYSKDYAEKLADIYLNNKMMDKYTDILYKLFYKYDKYDIDVYRKIKNLYSSKDWSVEKDKIINTIKNIKNNDRVNKILIEEELYDELYLIVRDCIMVNQIRKYEQYLLPKYKNELLKLYKDDCLKEVERANNRVMYREVARKVNHIREMDNEVVKSILKEINYKYFMKRPAMLDEFKKEINDLNEYI